MENWLKNKLEKIRINYYLPSFHEMTIQIEMVFMKIRLLVV